MSKEWDKIEASLKKLQPQIKKFSPAEADKRIASVKDALEDLWKGEDVYMDAVKAAQKGGNAGKKPDDFANDKTCKPALAKFKALAAAQEGEVTKLHAYAKASKPLGKTLMGLVADAKKNLDKKDKAKVKFNTDLNAALTEAKYSVNAMGKLTASETFYGARIDKVIENLFKKKVAKAKSGSSADAAKLIEKKEREKNAKQAVKMAQQVAKLCDNGLRKAGTDAKKADPFIKKADELLEKIEDIDDDYQTLKKKSAAMIKQSPDKTKIVKVINTVSKAHTSAKGKLAKTKVQLGDITA